MNYIVTTTIFEPSIALLRYMQMPDWKVVVAGDLKTPHEAYLGLDCIYLTPEMQQEMYLEISETIGWNCIQRRNLAIKYAYDMGAEYIALIDDDNIPLENWGEINLSATRITQYGTSQLVFDPLEPFRPYLWHRGYPIELVKDRMLWTSVFNMSQSNKDFHIQANLWNGDPDVDAICRMMNPEKVNMPDTGYYCSDVISPFNSQNTIIKREVVPQYMCIPFIGRMDDIWGGYYAQACGFNVMYASPTVYQERNHHDVTEDYKKEIIGYKNTYNLINDLAKDPENIFNYLPGNAGLALTTWLRSF